MIIGGNGQPLHGGQVCIPRPGPGTMPNRSRWGARGQMASLSGLPRSHEWVERVSGYGYVTHLYAGRGAGVGVSRKSIIVWPHDPSRWLHGW